MLNLAALWRMDGRMEKGAVEKTGGQLVGCNISKSQYWFGISAPRRRGSREREMGRSRYIFGDRIVKAC